MLRKYLSLESQQKIESYFLLVPLIVLLLLLSSCVTPPPRNINNICNIFKQYPQWRYDSQSVAHRWWVPVSVQMAIMHQESKFDARATPPRTKILWFIPWNRPSTAYGYAQALRATWHQYKIARGNPFISRDDFADAVDFIGWYAHQAYVQARIPRNDAYRLYLAYHEGIGGYQHKTYLRKPWLIQVSRKVKARASLYQAQLRRCGGN